MDPNKMFAYEQFIMKQKRGKHLFFRGVNLVFSDEVFFNSRHIITQTPILNFL